MMFIMEVYEVTKGPYIDVREVMKGTYIAH